LGSASQPLFFRQGLKVCPRSKLEANSVSYTLHDSVYHAGFPRGIEKVLNCEIGFQDLKKVLNLAKMCI